MTEERMTWTAAEYAEIRMLAGNRWANSVSAGSRETWDEWRRSLEARFVYADVMAAIVSLSELDPHFPSLADLIAETKAQRARRINAIRLLPGPKLDLDNAASEDEERWNERVKRHYIRPMQVVMEHEASGIPLDVHGFHGGVDADDLTAALLRRHYDRQIAAGVPITSDLHAEDPDPEEPTVVDDGHEERAIVFIAHRTEVDPGIASLALVESWLDANFSGRRGGVSRPSVGVGVGGHAPVAPGPSEGPPRRSPEAIAADFRANPQSWTPERVAELDPETRAKVRELVR